MPFRICLVTPFAWSQPHDVNEHVAGVGGGAPRARPPRDGARAVEPRAADLAPAGARSRTASGADVIALGPAVPISRRSAIGVPVGVRANLALALAQGAFDVVHGFEPGLPSLSYLALRDAHGLTVATFLVAGPARLPAGEVAARAAARARSTRCSRRRRRGREAAAERFPGDYAIVTPGVDVDALPRRARSSS